MIFDNIVTNLTIRNEKFSDIVINSSGNILSHTYFQIFQVNCSVKMEII